MTEAATGAAPAAEPGFRVTTSVADAATTVSVVGSVDMVTAPPFAQAVAAAQRAVPRGLVLDLSDVDFLGSAGLSVLVDAQRRGSDDGVAVVIVATNHPVLHALEVTGLDSVLTIVSTEQDALDRLTSDAPPES